MADDSVYASKTVCVICVTVHCLYYLCDCALFVCSVLHVLLPSVIICMASYDDVHSCPCLTFLCPPWASSQLSHLFE